MTWFVAVDFETMPIFMVDFKVNSRVIAKKQRLFAESIEMDRTATASSRPGEFGRDRNLGTEVGSRLRAPHQPAPGGRARFVELRPLGNGSGWLGPDAEGPLGVDR